MSENKITVPSAIESEAIVLGSIILDGQEAMKKIAHLLNYEDFYKKEHQYIYRAMAKLYRNKTDIDTITVHNVLKDYGFAEFVGGAGYLIDLSSPLASSAHIVSHARIVADRASLRNIIQTAKEIMKLTQEPKDLDEVLEQAESMIKSATRAGAKSEDRTKVIDLEEWRKVARDTEGEPNTLHGLSLGIKGLDEMVEGFEPGEVMILTGHTKHGKSRLATNIAWNVANQGKKVYFINTEMTNLQMGRRFNSLAGDKPPKGKILLNDKAGIQHYEVIRIMEEAKEAGADLIIVDHLHYFSRSAENQTGEISKVAKDFKDAAVEFELPLILLCHVKQGDTRKRPTLQMIKNSSSIAQDSDVVITVWLDDSPNSEGTETEILRLAHRSAQGTKKRTTVYNDGMLLTEMAPTTPMLGVNAKEVPSAGNIDNVSWEDEKG